MSIQYADGTYADASFAGTSVSSIVEGIYTSLAACGWTSTGSVGTRTMTSGTAAAGTLAARVILFSGTAIADAATVQFTSLDGSRTSGTFGLQTSTANYRILANKYQFFVMRPQAASAQRTFVCGGVPFLEAFLTSGTAAITEAIWCNGNSSSGSDTTVRDSFRTTLAIDAGSSWQCLNANAWSGSTGQGIGSPRLITMTRSKEQGTTYSQKSTQWHGDYAVKIPARIAWGPTTYTDEATCNGQLWNAVVIHRAYDMDAERTFDGYRWVNITHNPTADLGHPGLWIAVEASA